MPKYLNFPYEILSIRKWSDYFEGEDGEEDPEKVGSNICLCFLCLALNHSIEIAFIYYKHYQYLQTYRMDSSLSKSALYVLDMFAFNHHIQIEKLTVQQFKLYKSIKPAEDKITDVHMFEDCLRDFLFPPCIEVPKPAVCDKSLFPRPHITRHDNKSNSTSNR